MTVLPPMAVGWSLSFWNFSWIVTQLQLMRWASTTGYERTDLCSPSGRAGRASARPKTPPGAMQMSGVNPPRPSWRRENARGRGAQGSAVPHWSDARAAQNHHAGPTRGGQPDEVHLDSLNLDLFGRLSLTLIRFHFQTFAAPETHGWLLALRCATAHVGPRAAGPLCYDIVTLVQTLRSSRSTAFRFNSEGCACCRVWLTPEERQLMELVQALRQGRTGRARAVVQMLCEGAQGEELIAATQQYLHQHAPETSRNPV